MYDEKLFGDKMHLFFLQFVLPERKEIVLGLYHFRKEATEFSKSLPDVHHTKSFVEKLKSEVINMVEYCYIQQHYEDTKNINCSFS